MHRLLALVAVAALVTGACDNAARTRTPEGGPTAAEGRTATPPADSASASPTATPSRTATPSPSPSDGDDAPGGTDRVTVFYVRSAATSLFVEGEEHRLDEPTRAVARAAMEALVAGDPRHPELQTLAPDGTRVLDVAVADGVLTVDLSGEVRRGGGSAAEAAFREQLAHTGAQFASVEEVRLWVEGAPTAELWGHLDWSRPFRPDLLALSPIVIDEPAWDSTHAAGTLRVAGEANVFEATVTLRLFDPAGTQVEETFTTATCGTGCRGTWEHRFTIPDSRPGRWRVEATSPDASGGEGPPPFSTTVEFRVT